MKNYTKFEMTNRELAAAILLYDDLSMDVENIAEDYKHDYLTINTGRDGRVYVWYIDEVSEGAICVEDLKNLDEEDIERLLA
nr:MAG TPA: hypothetical protein [Caudoviricetes sp.]